MAEAGQDHALSFAGLLGEPFAGDDWLRDQAADFMVLPSARVDLRTWARFSERERRLWAEAALQLEAARAGLIGDQPAPANERAPVASGGQQDWLYEMLLEDPRA